jgi:hypothetical protein
MGDYPIRQLVLHRRILVFLGVESRSVGVVLAEGLFDLGGITSAEGLRDGEAGRAPFSSYALAFALQLRKSTGNLSQGRIQNCITLPGLLYERETRFVPVREECRMRVFVSSELRRRCGPEREDMAAGGGVAWLSDKLNNLYCTQNIIRVIETKLMG